jgi:glucose/arabinose dehydrogenase
MKRKRLPFGTAVIAALLLPSPFGACGFLAGKLPPFKDPLQEVRSIVLPEGFSIEVFVPEIENARSMALSPGNVLYVGTRNIGKVFAVPLVDGRPAEVITIAEGLRSPNGVAYRDGALYVAEIHRVLRFENIERSLHRPPEYTVVSTGFPTDDAHGWKFIQFGPDGKLYVPVGMPCNICEREDPRYGSIMRMNPDGSELEVFASGIRNTVGFDWHPVTKVLWFTDNGRDWLGDDLPPDELNVAPRGGMHFGFPYCYGKSHPDPEFTNVDCSDFEPAALELGPHVAALGMRVYSGSMFPEKYRNGIFIAEHGSWNRSIPIGYRVMFVELKDNLPVSYTPFAEGWLQGPIAWGRPVDVLVMPDGALLVSDDKAGLIYRISFSDESMRE